MEEISFFYSRGNPGALSGLWALIYGVSDNRRFVPIYKITVGCLFDNLDTSEHRKNINIKYIGNARCCVYPRALSSSFFFHSLSLFGISDADNPLACNVAPPSNVRTVLGSCAEKKSRGVIPDKSFFFAFFLDNGAADLVNGVRAILPLVSRSSPRTYTLTLLGQLLVSRARAHTHMHSSYKHACVGRFTFTLYARCQLALVRVTLHEHGCKRACGTYVCLYVHT